VGPCGARGFDVALSQKWLITADVRWMDIDSSVRVNGASVGTVHVDPWAFGVSAGYRF
jgi:outer membrane protein